MANIKSLDRKRNINIRLLVQIFFFVTILLTAINQYLSKKNITIPFISKASLHGLCPFGGVVSIYKFATEGSFVQKIHESSFVMLGIVIFLSILFGPVFCGWICPLGSVQEWLGRLGKKIFGRRYNNFIPQKLDKRLRYLRYFTFAWIVYVIAKTGKLLFNNVDPYYALFNFWTGEVTIQAIIVLIVVLVSSLFIERPWCKYLCPLGGFLGLFNFLSILKIRRNKNTCISCKACDMVCPMNIVVSDKDVIKNHQCIRCLKCTSEVSCPVENTVVLSTKDGEEYEGK
ncbi:4Fe-4S binding protein [Thermobrachium celere]|uniref:4Fe-4S binding protein n=1 Tax=Thermobrachium celere TaxID=53422 RepID=UPI0019425214|nr:4Fe-4S binding protein [Thermobrachium celere]GFR34535.1 hypothetical protein TCEA9_03470 [Thermobrachium celere]